MPLRTITAQRGNQLGSLLWELSFGRRQGKQRGDHAGDNHVVTQVSKQEADTAEQPFPFGPWRMAGEPLQASEITSECRKGWSAVCVERPTLEQRVMGKPRLQ